MKPKNLAINFFGATMGISALSLAWIKAYQLNFFNKFIYDLIRLLATGLWLFLVFLYLIKIILYFDKIKEEFNNPVKINFFAGASFSLLLLSSAWNSKIIWIIASFWHFSITILIINTWFFKNKFNIKDTNPTWFIPPVANFLIPITGANYGVLEVNWFFYSFSLLFWFILLIILVYRLSFLEKLPTPLNPTLFIFIAPPTLAFLASVNLNGEINIFAKNFYFIALFFVVFLAINLKLFIKTPFSLAAWAYSFPLAAFDIATLTMAEQGKFYLYFGIILLFIISIIILTLIYKTIIFLKKEKPF